MNASHVTQIQKARLEVASNFTKIQINEVDR